MGKVVEGRNLSQDLRGTRHDQMPMLPEFSPRYFTLYCTLEPDLSGLVFWVMLHASRCLVLTIQLHRFTLLPGIHLVKAVLLSIDGLLVSYI